MVKKSKRILIITDTHCGHRSGLTPPPWQFGEYTKSGTKRNKWGVIQREGWKGFCDVLKRRGPFDYCFDMGDSIDGPGKRSGGTELITADCHEQAEIAVACRDKIRLHANKGYKIIGVHGTAYHTGDAEDFDSIVADHAGYHKMGSHESVSVYGTVFDLKHHLGSSGIPHGRHTAAAKENMLAKI